MCECLTGNFADIEFHMENSGDGPCKQNRRGAHYGSRDKKWEQADCAEEETSFDSKIWQYDTQ